jgi:hypothetical protein
MNTPKKGVGIKASNEPSTTWKEGSTREEEDKGEIIPSVNKQ